MTVFYGLGKRWFGKSYFVLALSVAAAFTPQLSNASDADDIRARWISAISNDNTITLQSILTHSIDTATSSSDPLWEVTASNGKSALMVASKVGDEALARQLVTLGSDIKAKTITDGTAFMFAVLGDQQPLADWLLTLGADINARGSNGWTSAMIAAAKGLDGTLEWLIKQGANAQTPDVYGFSPLMRAADNGHGKAVILLLGPGDADVHWQDELSNTALHYAVSSADTNVIEQLLQAGASATLKNRSELSAIDLAQQALAAPGLSQLQLKQGVAVLELLKASTSTND